MAAIDDTEVFADDAVLDATLPNWRFNALGSQAIKAEFAKCLTDPAMFLARERIPVPDGELVIYEHRVVQGRCPLPRA